MSGEERRNRIIEILEKSSRPVSGSLLAKTLQVSRQVIVQDMALLRAQDYEITSTNRGYVLPRKETACRVYKVVHTDAQVAEEMNLIVDYGGAVEDVFIYHKIYGTVHAELHIQSRRDVEEFLEELKSGKSGLLKNVTSNYHYHTVSAPTERLLDLIEEKLREKGFLAELQDYEPVDFKIRKQ